jgi:hypothetical protein
MNMQTNTQNRKVLAEELSRLIGEPYRYLGVPSCAYQVGPYTINRDGSISGDDFEAINSFLVENDYIHETIGTVPEGEENSVTEDDSEADVITAIADALDQVPSVDSVTQITGVTETHVSIPIQEYSPLALTCLLNPTVSPSRIARAVIIFLKSVMVFPLSLYFLRYHILLSQRIVQGRYDRSLHVIRHSPSDCAANIFIEKLSSARNRISPSPVPEFWWSDRKPRQDRSTGSHRDR